jgi:two-component system sensor histidine kinase VicK
MRVHFFSSTDLRDRSDFGANYILQNLKTTQSVSIIYFLISLGIRILVEAFNIPAMKISHMDEYDLANWISLIVTPFFYLGSIQLIKLFELNKKYETLARIFVFLFAFFIVINTMRATFYSMHNPRNTLVMYMMGLIITGVFFTFEFYETLILTVLTGLFFAAILPFYQHSFNELFMNNLASLVLLVVFFCISRFSFSYRADNFLKLKAIEEKNIEIENASQVKNEILGIVAHDLRNPLAAIKTIAMMMELDKSMDEDNQDNLQMIKASCDKATSIINDLLETVHNDIGNEFDVEKTELNKFLLIVVDEWLKNKSGHANVLYYGTKQPVYALINPEKMQRVMDNLISNAVKFSSEGDHIEISLKELNGEAHISIKDFGMGIPEVLLPFIFDRFSKASRKGRRGEESIGLGLSIVREIIRKHGGEIEVNSVEEVGTTFTIKLPQEASSYLGYIDAFLCAG